MTSVQLAAARAANEGWDSDGSLSWEDFFGTSTDLAPSLLGMYDQLIGRVPQKGAELSAVSAQHKRPAPPLPPPQQAQHAQPAQHRIMEVVISDVVPRPLSVSSIASSSSSSSSGTSSCSGGGGGGGGGRLGGAPKSSAYLASIESLEDDDSDDDVADRDRQKAAVDRLKGSITSQGSADSGVGSPCSFISSPSPPQGRPRYCDPHLSYMDRVVMEIVETEGVYVKDLEQVIQGYLEKWRAALDPSIGERHLSDLFSNIEPIYQFNSGFLAQLERCGLDPVQVARCFVRNNAGFAVYTQYCTNYPRTVSVLTELMRQDATVRLFRERQAALQHTLPLGSYLLKPVQRILKYHLLLQNLVKHYACEAEGYSDIVDALSAMTGIAHHINDMKRRHEHSVRVQEIQSLLYSWEGEDLTTYGELCAEGAFRMSGAKALRHAFLFDKMLLITKKKEEATLGYKAHIMCSNLMLIESVPGEPLSFHVIPFDNPRLQYTLQARNLEQKREWTLQLKRVILENYNAVIPSHARQLVMELGQNRTDDDILAEKGTPKRQHSAPEYLEKRKQDRDRRKSETGLRYRLRRSRKSDCGSSLESPLPHHRGRRASSNSHERSPSREGLRSASPISVKERFGSWRRKSEPSCHSPLSGSKLVPSKLSVAPEPDLDPAPSDIEQPEELDLVISPEPPQNPSPEPDSDVGTCEDSPQRDVTSETLRDDDEAKTLEEIVGQLLLQNREFQKILKKQQRTVGLRARRDETTDTEAEEEPRGAAAAYRAHRHAHTRALRTQQKAFAGLTKFQRRVVANADEEDHVAPPADPLRGETWNEAKPEEPDSKSMTDEGFGNYDNLQNIWESVQKQQEEIRRLAESTERECRPPTVDLAAEPTSPAVWLKQQSRHLASPTKKSGSLPRSFQLTPEPSTVNVQTALTAAQRGKRGDRPFTIASDKPAEIDLDDIERYVAESAAARAAHRFPVGGDTTEEDSMTEYTATPGASMNDLNVHPEYKIYRPSVSRAALKHVLSSVRLGGTRTSSETLDDREHSASKFVYALARQYSKTLKERIKNIMGEHHVGSRIGSEECLEVQRTPSPVPLLPTPVLPTYKQGSSGLGARIAQSEYANPRLLFPHIHTKGNVRPDSLLSASSHFTSSSEGEKTSDPAVPARLPEDASDGSNDGYYERSFEAIESLCENDAFRDSAVFSDHEDGLETSSVHLHRNNSIEAKISRAKNGKVPPPVPAKPNALRKTNVKSAVVDRVTIQEKEQHLVRGLEGISKSIRDRRRELELWRANKEKSAEEEGDTSSQHSAASTVIEVGKEEEGTPRGWVRHVIGKLQKATADDDETL